MTEPLAAKRPRTAIAIALAIMLLACGLIVTALALLAQGAVANDEGSAEPAAAARELISKQSDLSEPRSALRNTPDDHPHRPRGQTLVSGSFALGAEPTPDEQSLEARIAGSSVGGGFIADGRIHVVVEGAAAAEPAQQ